MLKRRCIGTAHNFANKPVSFACNGVQTRRRVSHKAGAKEGGRTARNSRNASRARKKILQKAARKAACVPDDRRKARRRVVWHPERTTAAKERGTGKGYREGGEAAHRGGDIGGKKTGQGWKAGRKARRGEKVRRVGVVWVQLLARAYIYSSYI